MSLPQLFTAGVECGHTAAKAELKHQIGTVYKQLEQLRDHFREVQERANDDREQLAGELLATQRRFHSSQIQMSEMQVQAGQMQLYVEQLQRYAEYQETQAGKMQEHAEHLDRRSSLRATASASSRTRRSGA